MDIGPMAASVGRWSRPHALKKKHNLSQIHSQTTIFQLTFQICGANTWTGGKKPNIGILGAALTNRYPGRTKYLDRWWGFIHTNKIHCFGTKKMPPRESEVPCSFFILHIFSIQNEFHCIHRDLQSGCDGRGWAEQNVLMASCCHIPLHPRQALPASSPQTILAKGHQGIHLSHRCCCEFQLPTFTWVTFQSEVCLLLTYHHQLSISCNDGCKLASWIPLRAQPSSSLTHFPYCTYTAETWQETEFKQVNERGLDLN